MQDFILYQKLCDFSDYLFPIVERFPKHEKFALSSRIKNLAHETVMHVIRMQKAHPKNIREKQRCAKEVDCNLAMLRHFIRHAHGRRCLNNKKLKVLTEKLAELGKIIGGLLSRFSGTSS